MERTQKHKRPTTLFLLPKNSGHGTHRVPSASGHAQRGQIRKIRVEEFEQAGHFVIRAEVPGIDIDRNVELSVQNQQLRLVIHRERREKSSDTHHFRSEFQYGSFTRVVPLPVSASEKDVKATYKDGILEVRIKLDGTQSQGHRIPITAE